MASLIVGTWMQDDAWIDMNEEAFGKKYENYIKFNSDGTAINVASDEGVINNFFWKISGNQLSLYGEDVVATTSTINKLTDTELSLTTLGIDTHWKKVADSVIDKYK